MKTLKVVSVDYDREDKRGTKYTYVQVSTPSKIKALNEMNELVTMRVEARKSGFIAYPESYLRDANDNPLAQYGHDFVEGETVPGDIEMRKVVPYFIANPNGPEEHEGQKGRWVDVASVIVFGDSTEADWEIKVQQAFKRRGFILESNDAEALIAHPSTTPTRNREQREMLVQDEHPDLVEHEATETVATKGSTTAPKKTTGKPKKN